MHSVDNTSKAPASILGFVASREYVDRLQKCKHISNYISVWLSLLLQYRGGTARLLPSNTNLSALTIPGYSGPPVHA